MERLKQVGKIKPQNSIDIKKSRLGLGFEKLDRDAFNPDKAYDKMAQSGVKWARIQSGWQKTEKIKGVYNFEWLDKVVDNLLKRRIQPWVCLCYGNEIYNEEAKNIYGAVGCPPIHTEEQKEGWANYVKEFVKHYKDRVFHYEVWNEPDGDWCWKHGSSGAEYGQFTVDTAKAIREVYENAYIIGGSVCLRPIGFLVDAFEMGMGNWINAITYHDYTYDETDVFNRVAALRGVINRYNPKIEIIQGESGSQSRSDGEGAMKGCAGTQRKQAKQLLRRAIIDLMTEVKFTSYFSCIDMKEALNGTVGNVSSCKDFGYFGVLGADFDENGNATGEYIPKESYYALQNIAAMFSDDCIKYEVPAIFFSAISPRLNWISEPNPIELTHSGFKLDSGELVYVYWKPTEILSTEFDGTISVEIATDKDEIKIVDLLDGNVYRVPENMIEKSGIKTKKIMNIPLRDYPLAILV